MNIESATMKVPYFEAHTAFKAYRTAVKEHKATRDDVILYRALRRLLRGQHVIDINLAIGAGGRHYPSGLPKLAIARADWTSVIADGTFEDGVQGFLFTSSTWGRKPKGRVFATAASFPALAN